LDESLKNLVTQLDVNKDGKITRDEVPLPVQGQFSFIAAEDKVRKLAGAENPLDRSHDFTRSLAQYGQETLVRQSGAKQAAETGLAGQFGRYRISSGNSPAVAKVRLE
jgi:hypothetical protein